MDNIIKIYLRQTGGIAELIKTIPLYVGMYNTAILDVYVPITLIDGSVSVKAGAILTANDGTKSTTESLPMTYKETTTFRQVQYEVYELNPFPANFLTYAGDQDIVINIVKLDNEQVESVITTQIASIDVLDSEFLPDETIDATAVDLLSARITANEHNIATNTEDITANTSQINTNTLDIASNAQRISQIEETMSTGENPVGELTVNTLTGIETALNNYVQSVEGRAPMNGDSVIVKLQIAGATDEAYKYIYTNSGWTNYQIPPIESASNTDKGIVQGTLGQSTPTQVDITDGKVNRIYVADNSSNLRDIQEYLNTNANTTESIIDGTTKVGYAVKADEDANGNNIITTYMTQNAGVTKQQMKDYALPRTFNDIFYLGQGQFKPTQPTTSISYTQTFSAIGTYELLTATIDTTASFELSHKNSYQNTFYISTSIDTTCQFRLDTTAGEQVLNTEFSNQVVMTANNIYKVQFNDNLNNLSDITKFENGSPVLSQTLSVVLTNSNQITITVYSNSSYLSTFNLNTNNYLIQIESGYLGEIPSIVVTGTVDNDIATFAIRENLLDNTIVKFTLTYEGSAEYLKLVDEATLEEYFVITPYNTGQTIGVGEVDRPKISDFNQTRVETSGGITTLTFVGVVDTIDGYGTKIYVNEDNLTEIKDAIENLELNMPTKTSDLTNDGDGTSQFITEEFLDDSYITKARIRVLFNELLEHEGGN